jgi:hypothetical protein
LFKKIDFKWSLIPLEIEGDSSDLEKIDETEFDVSISIVILLSFCIFYFIYSI